MMEKGGERRTISENDWVDGFTYIYQTFAVDRKTPTYDDYHVALTTTVFDLGVFEYEQESLTAMFTILY